MNTNDFSKCKVGDKLWGFGYGEVTVVENTQYAGNLRVETVTGETLTYLKIQPAERQMLYFSNPNIIAPPEPKRLPDYKPGEWIAVWDNYGDEPKIKRFWKMSEKLLRDKPLIFTIDRQRFANYCTIGELPEVLAKWGEK